MSYTIEDGIVRSNACEISVVHHCNLSCRACSHLSPVSERHFVSAGRVFEDLSTLAKWYRVEHVRLLGGEPLLHPDLLGVIDAVRKSGISGRVRVVTNGVLLCEMPDELWKAVDELHVSIYPVKEMTAEQLQWCQHKAQLHDVHLELLYFDRFRESYSESGTDDDSLIQRVYDTCQIAHQWHCHNVQDGFFHKCPQSVFLPRVLGDVVGEITVDGIKISDSPVLGRDLLAYLESSKPLRSCQFCLGSVGKLSPHQLVSRKRWRKLQQHPTEEIVDWDYLAVLEDLDAEADNLCQRAHLLDPANQDLIASYNLFDTFAEA